MALTKKQVEDTVAIIKSSILNYKIKYNIFNKEIKIKDALGFSDDFSQELCILGFLSEYLHLYEINEDTNIKVAMLPFNSQVNHDVERNINHYLEEI